MATILTGTAGKILGKFLNKTINSTINNTFFSKKRRIFNKKTHTHHSQIVAYGNNIPLVFGTMPVKGALLWQSEIVEHCIKNKRFLNFQQVEDEIYQYTVSFMIGICQGPISSIGRVWLNDQLIDEHWKQLKLTSYEYQAIDHQVNVNVFPKYKKDIVHKMLEKHQISLEDLLRKLISTDTLRFNDHLQSFHSK
jgi:hypothetical protein